MKKILHLLPSSHYSGAENVAIQIVSLFKKIKGFDMALCCLKGPLELYLKELGIHYYAMDSFNKKEIASVILEYNPDIIHAHDFSASCMAARLGLPVISHIHNNPLWLSKICFNSLAYAIVLHRFSYVIGVSQSVYDEYIFRRLMKKKFQVLHNVVDKDKICELAKEKNDIHKIDLLFVGRLASPKNPLFFLEIVKKVIIKKKQLQAFMIGDGELRKQCEEFVKDNDMEKNVHIIGFQKNPYPFMKKADVLVVPSIFEGFGLVAVESMILGTPVLCRNVGGLPEIIDKSCGEILNTVDDFADKITSLNASELNYLSVGAIKKADLFCDTTSYTNFLIKKYSSI